MATSDLFKPRQRPALLFSLGLLLVALLVLAAVDDRMLTAVRDGTRRRLMLLPSAVVRSSVDAAAAAAASSSAPDPQLQLPADFRFNKVVALIAYDRFEYFRQVIDALRRAWGSEDYTLLIAIDGPPLEAAAATGGDASNPGAAGAGASTASSFSALGWGNIVRYSKELELLSRQGLGFRHVIVNVSATNLGVWPNKKRGLAAAMELSDFVVVLEDDIVVERDALRWFEWHVTSGFIFRRPEVATASCWAPSFPRDAEVAVEGLDLLTVRQLGLLDKFYVNGWATPWGWATWRRTWDALGANWTGQDINLAQAVVARGWGESIPLVARCNNIGALGVHKRGADVGHIQQRALTSASFPRLRQCSYTELTPRTTTPYVGGLWYGNLTAPLNKVVRNGIFADRRFANTSLPAARGRLKAFVRRHPPAKLWQSSC